MQRYKYDWIQKWVTRIKWGSRLFYTLFIVFIILVICKLIRIIGWSWILVVSPLLISLLELLILAGWFMYSRNRGTH